VKNLNDKNSNSGRDMTNEVKDLVEGIVKHLDEV
jgi:hypothetical protein